MKTHFDLVARRLSAACFAFGSLIAAERPADSAKATAVLAPENGRLIVDVRGVPPPAPVFFSAAVDQMVRLGQAEIAGEMRIKLRVLQGRPENLTLGLSGDGEVVSVSGKDLRDWAVRQGTGAASGRRFLDLRPLFAEPRTAGAPSTPRELEIVVQTRLRQPAIPGAASILIATPGDAVGFSASVSLQPDPTVDFRVTTMQGLTPLRTESREGQQFVTTGEGRLEVRLTARGAAADDAELFGAQLSGRVDESAGSVVFQLRGQLRAQKAGARLRLLTGRAAPIEQTAGDGWHVELVSLGNDCFAYDLVADRAGAMSLEFGFAAAVRETGDWHTLDFSMPAGAVVPLQLDGLGADVSFKPDASVVPTAATKEGASSAAAPSRWQGFLPANGAISLAWKHSRESRESVLAFTSFELAEVRIGAGLLRQDSQVSFRILQGKLNGVRFRLEGASEILGVEGASVIGWKIVPGERGGRSLDVRFNRPMETQGSLVIHSQTELGSWPAKAEPTRLIPEGGVRHSGFVRVANSGAVRLEVTDLAGLMQLAPAQFPGAALEPAPRQMFVYRFPSANYGYRVLATQIMPEVAVSAITTYELTDTARVIDASLELDVREAPLRDWTLRIPADYTVVALTGSDVADYVAENDAANGTRALRILFGRAIEGRQLLQLRLEKNQAVAAGDWSLPALQFPEAKSVRGHVGAVSTPGYRLVPTSAERLVEVPLSFFPKQTRGLQQAWRLREPDWTAQLRVEALGQSVQADVFHLYSLKEGVVTSSVLLNYFVVGAPATEWRVEVPASVGNIDVIGQNVRRDWRREGDQVIVSLHQPVLGAATLLITFEQPMSARGGVLAPGQVRPVGVQSERGFIQVVSPLQVKHEIRRVEGLLKLEPTELPAEYRLLTSAPSLAVYQYTARPFAFELAVEWFAPAELVDQVVDFAQLSSQVSRDGQVVTEAKFFVKTRGRKALRLALPTGVKLWEARVDNEVVNAQSDGEQTVIPLPARTNPNDPVVVVLRVGQPATKSGSAVQLISPRAVTAPIVISEWNARSDTGRFLVPQQGNAELVQPALTETGFEWISQRGGIGTFAVLSLIGLGAMLVRANHGWRLPLGLLVFAIATAGALLMTLNALSQRRPNLPELKYAATVVPAGESVSLQMANLPEWRAMIVGWGIAAIVAGVALLLMRSRRLIGDRANPPGEPNVAARWGRVALPVMIDAVLPVAGILLILAGLLAQRGGAVLFFGALSVATFVRMLVPGLILWRRERRERIIEPGTGPAGAVTSLAIAGLLALALGGASKALAATKPSVPPPVIQAAAEIPSLPDGTRPAQSIVQTWTIRDDRLFAEAEIMVRGVAGDSFLLLRAPAVLTQFSADGMRIAKTERDGAIVYHVVLERDGTVTARLKFELPVPDRSHPIALPTGPAATQRITVELDQPGWEIVSPMAVETRPIAAPGEQRSGATLVLAPHAAPMLQLQPKRRNLAAEATQFFAELATVFVPSPGVVNGFTRVTVRPVQGRVSNVELEIPAGFTVGDVTRGPVGSWRFDPETRRLQVAVEPAQTGVFTFDLETQLGASELPFSLVLAPVRVRGAAGDIGTLAIAFGGEAQPEGIRTSELSAVNVQDFDPTLLPRTREYQPAATVQNVWRYGPTGGRVELKIAPVAPEVRVTSRQVLSLDDDRMVMAVDLRVAIARVGIFKLSFPLPAGLEVEALTGRALNHWTEAQEGALRIVTLHLNGRTIGEQDFHLTLAGAAPRAQDAWPFPRLLLREAARQTAEALVVPGKGIRVRVVTREHVTQLDPRTVGGQQPGTLAFRLLQDDWVLTLGIEALEAWVTVQALQEVTVREGQTLTRIGVRYRVENAAVRFARVVLPGLGEEGARTVRASGPAVSDIVRVADTPDTWEIRFQRGIAGETDVQIEFQGPASGERSRETIATPTFVGARQVAQFVTVRAGGRLELAAGNLPRGWTRTDWSAVPVPLQSRSDRSVPALCFRVAEPEAALAVIVRRHDVAEALKLRVTQADLLTLFAPTGAFLTSVELKVDVIEKSTLRVRLPAGARLFNTFVNGESVSVVREGEAWLFYVSANVSGNRAAAVRLVYAASAVPRQARGDISLTGPRLSVPLENVTWRVVLPPGYELDSYTGGLRLSEARGGDIFGVEQYVSLMSSKRSAEAKEGISLLQQATSLLQKGEQEKASAVLSQASNNVALDAASNEDARVQLRNLKTQQAVLGLNTRRQRLYFDNRADVVQNAQLEQAANLNPFMQGKLNYDPRQADQLLLGNTAEENTALRGIAARIVDQQLAAEPAPGAIDVTLPERGRVLTFTRSLQVDGTAPLELKLDIDKSTRTSGTLMVLLLAGLAAIVGIELNRKSGEQSS